MNIRGKICLLFLVIWLLTVLAFYLRECLPPQQVLCICMWSKWLSFHSMLIKETCFQSKCTTFTLLHTKEERKGRKKNRRRSLNLNIVSKFFIQIAKPQPSGIHSKSSLLQIGAASVTVSSLSLEHRPVLINAIKDNSVRDLLQFFTTFEYSLVFTFNYVITSTSILFKALFLFKSCK